MGARRAKGSTRSKVPRKAHSSPNIAAHFLDTGIASLRNAHAYIGQGDVALMQCVAMAEKCMRQAIEALGFGLSAEADHPGQARMDG